MTTEKMTKLKKSTAIMRTSKATHWCYVDTDNNFQFMSRKFHIDTLVSNYQVHNKAGVVEDYTNEAYMDQVLAVLTVGNQIKFYDMNYNLIPDTLIHA